MTKETAIKLFSQKHIRCHWDSDREKWYFSIVGVVGGITDKICFTFGRLFVKDVFINPETFCFSPLSIFCNAYPKGRNLCISPNIRDIYSSRRSDLTIEFIGNIGQYLY